MAAIDHWGDFDGHFPSEKVPGPEPSVANLVNPNKKQIKFDQIKFLIEISFNY